MTALTGVVLRTTDVADVPGLGPRPAPLVTTVGSLELGIGARTAGSLEHTGLPAVGAAGLAAGLAAGPTLTPGTGADTPGARAFFGGAWLRLEGTTTFADETGALLTEAETFAGEARGVEPRAGTVLFGNGLPLICEDM